MGWAFAPNFIDTSNNTYSGILIATQADRTSSQAIVTKHYEPVSNTPKVSLFTKLKSGKILLSIPFAKETRAVEKCLANRLR